MRDVKFFIVGTIVIIFEALCWAVVGAITICLVLPTTPIWYPIWKWHRCRKRDNRKTKWERLFQQAVSGVVKQGCLGVESGHSIMCPPPCRYRTSTGDKCGVGQLLTDKEYHPGMEGNDVGSLIYDGSRFPERLRGFRLELIALQKMHDDASEAPADEQMSVFIERCHTYAKREGIAMPLLPSRNNKETQTKERSS